MTVEALRAVRGVFMGVDVIEVLDDRPWIIEANVAFGFNVGDDEVETDDPARLRGLRTVCEDAMSPPAPKRLEANVTFVVSLELGGRFTDSLRVVEVLKRTPSFDQAFAGTRFDNRLQLSYRYGMEPEIVALRTQVDLRLARSTVEPNQLVTLHPAGLRPSSSSWRSRRTGSRTAPRSRMTSTTPCASDMCRTWRQRSSERSIPRRGLSTISESTS